MDIAVVTGASGGIGAAIAKAIAKKSEGQLAVCIHYNGNQKAAEALVKELPDSFAVQADLSAAEGRKSLLDAVLAKGTPFCLINNAGIDRPHEPALMISEEGFDKLVSTNLKAPLFLMRDFAKEMARNESGVIVNISSVLARRAVIGSAVYRATKAALEALTMQFASELGPKGVRVVAVAPGFIETAMTAEIPEAQRSGIKKDVALGAFGAPEAIAETVWHAIENQYLTGAVIAVDGGMAL
ncbi:MAG: beta-ketoacyl-ACP reductase [Elusimicrobia bacterium CG11_big_fil_rev_8_21_14_0_20_64_6]|nr:MAG: beta-ketoacyl-ACP reductase [Elusimicrobia bacterium CG11_big_fil_rev_8_21_14_0_20_64_6]